MRRSSISQSKKKYTYTHLDVYGKKIVIEIKRKTWPTMWICLVRWFDSHRTCQTEKSIKYILTIFKVPFHTFSYTHTKDMFTSDAILVQQYTRNTCSPIFMFAHVNSNELEPVFLISIFYFLSTFALTHMLRETDSEKWF